MTPASPVASSKYERFIQWTAGPIAIIAGWLATQITTHFGIFGAVGLSVNPIAHAITVSVTFAVGAGVTYAAHHKFLSNVPKWWDHERPQLTAIAGTIGGPIGTELATHVLDASPDQILTEIDTVEGKLGELLAHPGTPPAAVVAGLAPSATVPA